MIWWFELPEDDAKLRVGTTVVEAGLGLRPN